jgi:hypothetical protein
VGHHNELDCLRNCLVDDVLACVDGNNRIYGYAVAEADGAGAQIKAALAASSSAITASFR